MEKALLKNHKQKKMSHIHPAFGEIFMLIDFLCFPIPCMFSSC